MFSKLCIALDKTILYFYHNKTQFIDDIMIMLLHHASYSILWHLWKLSVTAGVQKRGFQVQLVSLVVVTDLCEARRALGYSPPCPQVSAAPHRPQWAACHLTDIAPPAHGTPPHTSLSTTRRTATGDI